MPQPQPHRTGGPVESALLLGGAVDVLKERLMYATDCLAQHVIARGESTSFLP